MLIPRGEERLPLVAGKIKPTPAPWRSRPGGTGTASDSPNAIYPSWIRTGFHLADNIIFVPSKFKNATQYSCFSSGKSALYLGFHLIPSSKLKCWITITHHFVFYVQKIHKLRKTIFIILPAKIEIGWCRRYKASLSKFSESTLAGNRLIK